MPVAIYYGISSLATAAVGFLISSWLTYFYLPPGGPALVPAAFLGIAVLISRGLGAFIPPVVGYLSDRTETRWGRRRPYMFAAGLPLGVFFFLLWQPPFGSESFWNLAYLAGILLLHRIALSFYRIPYLAMLPELGVTDHERINLSAWQSGMMLTGYLVGGLAGPVIEQFGFQKMACAYAILALVCYYIPVFLLREKTDPPVAFTKPAGFFENYRIPFQNRPFLIFAVVWALYLMTTTLIQAAVPFIVTEICALSKSGTVWLYIPTILVSLGFYPLVSQLARKFGKWRVYAASLLLSGLVLPFVYFIGSSLWIPLRSQCVGWAVLQSAAVSGAVVLSAAFFAELSDLDTHQTGVRREGTYYAVSKILEDVFNGMAMALFPFLLQIDSSAHSVGALGVRLTGVVSGFFMLVAFVLFLRYPHEPA